MTMYVEWVGGKGLPFAHRSVSDLDWRQLGIPEDKQSALKWDQSNGWRVLRSDISDEALPYIQADSEFRVVDSDNDPEPDPDQTVFFQSPVAREDVVVSPQSQNVGWMPETPSGGPPDMERDPEQARDEAIDGGNKPARGKAKGRP